MVDQKMSTIPKMHIGYDRTNTAHAVRHVRCWDPTCACDGCQEDRCEGKACVHFGFYPLLKVKVMSTFDSHPMSRKEISQLEKHPIKISERSIVACACGKFCGRVKELAHDGLEYHCPVCGCYNLQYGMFYVRIFTKDPYVQPANSSSTTRDAQNKATR